MNILAFSWRDPKHPQAGGAEQVVHEHMKGWIENGHSVTLFSSQFKGCKNVENIDGVNVIRKGKQLLGVNFAGFYWYLFKRDKKYDIVIDQFHGLPFFTPLYVRVPKVAVLQEVAREVWFQNDLPKPLNWIIGMIGYIGEPFIFLFYRNTQFIVGSPSAQKDLEKFGINKKNISVIHHGVIIHRPKPMPKKEKVNTVLFLGAITKDKGAGDAVESFKILNNTGNYQFWVIGKGETNYAKYLMKKVKMCGLSDRVKFWGFVSDNKKFELLAKSHIMLNPSIREGWGLVNIEANAMGTPVISYNSPGLVDSVQGGVNGIMVGANTPEKLAEATDKLLKDKNKYEKMSKSSIKYSNQFSWEKSKKKSMLLLNKIYSKT